MKRPRVMWSRVAILAAQWRAAEGKARQRFRGRELARALALLAWWHTGRLASGAPLVRQPRSALKLWIAALRAAKNPPAGSAP